MPFQGQSPGTRDISAIFRQNEPFPCYQGGGGAIVTQLLPFHIGVEIALSAKMIAQRYYEIGLVNRRVPDEKRMEDA